jgi:hypothetical protein
MISVALTVVVMPLMVLPFLVLMNDTRFVKDAPTRQSLPGADR